MNLLFSCRGKTKRRLKEKNNSIIDLCAAFQLNYKSTNTEQDSMPSSKEKLCNVLTSEALRLPSSPSCSESLLDSLPPLCEEGVAACPLERIQISTRTPSSPLPLPLTAGPREPPSCSCFLLRSSCSAYESKVCKQQAPALP